MFRGMGVDDLSLGGGYRTGQRRCPNPECMAHVFVVRHGPVAFSYPAAKLDFDPTGVPEAIRLRLEEAITCHANQCWIAAAMLVRRTLEELCDDRGATGKSLNDKLEGLKAKIVIPAELLEALHHLRLLGNDAAHIEAKTYATVGEAEVEIAIALAKEILKSCYQYRDMLGKLKALQKTPVTQPGA